jgi:hypothetical protein
MTNPQEHSRDQLFTWLDRHDFTITDNGDFVGYKGCALDAEGVAVSTRAVPEKDKVTVNGVLVPTGERVPNKQGDVVEMPRSLVDFNAYVGCSTGLHVGTYAYAKSFAPALLEVHVNPRDVVSVPTDCDAQKIRCCRYTVVGPVEDEYKAAVLPKAQVETPVVDDDDEFEDDTIREGDTVRLTQFITTLRGRLNPGGTETFVVQKVSKYGTGDYLQITVNNHTDSWAAVRFEKVKEAAKPTDVTKATAWDTRLNYTKQQRYPKGHPKAGQFIPKV